MQNKKSEDLSIENTKICNQIGSECNKCATSCLIIKTDFTSGHKCLLCADWNLSMDVVMHSGLSGMVTSSELILVMSGGG